MLMRVGQAPPTAPRALRKSWQKSTRQGADDLKNLQLLPLTLRDPLHGGPRRVRAPHGCSQAIELRSMVLSDLPERVQ